MADPEWEWDIMSLFRIGNLMNGLVEDLAPTNAGLEPLSLPELNNNAM